MQLSVEIAEQFVEQKDLEGARNRLVDRHAPSLTVEQLTWP